MKKNIITNMVVRINLNYTHVLIKLYQKAKKWLKLTN